MGYPWYLTTCCAAKKEKRGEGLLHPKSQTDHQRKRKQWGLGVWLLASPASVCLCLTCAWCRHGFELPPQKEKACRGHRLLFAGQPRTLRGDAGERPQRGDSSAVLHLRGVLGPAPAGCEDAIKSQPIQKAPAQSAAEKRTRIWCGTDTRVANDRRWANGWASEA